MTIRLFITFLLTFCAAAHGQLNTFLKTFSSTPAYNTSEAFISGIDTLSKNSFVTTGAKIRGSINSSDTLVIDSYLQKTEVSGLTKWFRCYHINGYTLALKDLQVIANKQILAVGHTDDFGTPNGNLKHGIIMKTDSNGYVVWCRLYPRQKIYNVSRRSDGNIAILASDSGAWYGKRLKLALLNSSGNLIWCKRLMCPDSNFYGVHLKEGINKSFLINANYKVMILLDSNGNHINDISYNPAGSLKGFHSIINFYNQYYYISGFNLFGTKLISTITKTDASLNIIWHKSYQSSGGDSEFQNIVGLAQNNLMVFCEPENYGVNGAQRSGFAFFDSSGVFKKSHLFSSDTIPLIPEDFIQLKNGKFLFSAFNSWGQCFGIVDTTFGGFCTQTSITWSTVALAAPVNTNSFTSLNGQFNYSLVPVYVYQPVDLTIEYVCSSGPTGPLDPTPTSLDEEDDFNFINIFPLPTHDFIFIEFNLKIEKRSPISLQLHNAFGLEVMSDLVFPDARYLPVDLRNFPDGIYYLTIKIDANKTITKKVVVTKK